MMSDLVKQSGASDEEKAAIHAAMESLSKPGVVGHSIAIAKPGRWQRVQYHRHQ